MPVLVRLTMLQQDFYTKTIPSSQPTTVTTMRAPVTRRVSLTMLALAASGTRTAQKSVRPVMVADRQAAVEKAREFVGTRGVARVTR